jgi:hypothetical protein
MVFTKNHNLYFLDSTYFFPKKDILLHISKKKFLIFLSSKLFNEILPNFRLLSIKNKSTVLYKLETYIDDLDKFDFYNRKYRSSKNELKSKKPKFKKNTISKKNALLRSIYDSESGLLKTVKTWNYYLNGRYGIGHGITSLFSKYNGTLVNSLLLMSDFNIYTYQTSFRQFFLKNLTFFDYTKSRLEMYSYMKHKSRFTFKGWCFFNRYPVNGQKRRTNYKTTRSYNQFIMLKMKK